LFLEIIFKISTSRSPYGTKTDRSLPQRYRKLHDLFEPYHIRGECYNFCPEIEKWITKNCLREKKKISLNNKLDYLVKIEVDFTSKYF